ncbi:hypothetical protein HDU81_009470, partial [Chytriomyces hyalinus]
MLYGSRDVINSMAEKDETSILYLLDVPAGKLNFESFARVLEKAEQLVVNEIVDHKGVVSKAYLDGMVGAEVRKSHVNVSAATKIANAAPETAISEVGKENSTIDEADVVPPEESQVVHKSYSKWISEFTQLLENKQEESVPTANNSELLLSCVLAFETRFKAMDARNLYQPVLKFESPCRVRFVENTDGLVPGKISIDACALPLQPFPS